MCNGDYTWTGGMDCVLKDVSNTVLFFSCLVCVAAVCAVGILVGLEPGIVRWRMFLILCCFLFPSVCVAAVCAVGVQVGLVASIVLEDVSNTTLFLFPSVCGGCVCSGFLVGLQPWIVCWRMFLIQCCFLFPSVCGGCVCSGVSSGTRAVDCVLEDVSNTMLFSLVSCLVCVAAVCAVGIIVGLVAWILC